MGIDTGSGGKRAGGIWIGYQIVAAVVAVGALLIAAAVVLSPPQEGTLRVTVASLTVAGLSVVLFVASRRHRRTLAEEARDALAAPEQLMYRQDAMPWGYWTALGFVGGFGLLLVGATVALNTVVRGAASGVTGGLFWDWLIYATVWIYGVRQAYQVRILDGELEWRAPFRRRLIPVQSLRSVSVVRLPGVLGEREAALTTAGGERLLITVPNGRHEQRFHRFCEALRRRAPGLDAEGRDRSSPPGAPLG